MQVIAEGRCIDHHFVGRVSNDWAKVPNDRNHSNDIEFVAQIS